MIGVCIVTYNQEQYIGQCIESAISQVCSEPYVVYIGEDRSTDNTLDICRKYANEYPDKIKLVENQTNLGLVGNTINLLRIMQADGCDYIAMLDGDDYWIDDYKLEKEVNFLHANPDYGLVHTQLHLLVNGKIQENKRKNVVEGDVFEFIGEPCAAIGNCTCMFRTPLLKYCNLNDFITHRFLSVDYVMYAIFAKYTKFGFLENFTAVWRRGHDSVSHNNNVEKQISYLQNDDRMWRYLSKLFPKRFTYDEASGMDYYNYRCFQIAFKGKDWKRAKQAINDGFKITNWKISLKRIFVRLISVIK